MIQVLFFVFVFMLEKWRPIPVWIVFHFQSLMRLFVQSVGDIYSPWVYSLKPFIFKVRRFFLQKLAWSMITFCSFLYLFAKLIQDDLWARQWVLLIFRLEWIIFVINWIKFEAPAFLEGGRTIDKRQSTWGGGPNWREHNLLHFEELSRVERVFWSFNSWSFDE